MLTAKVADLYYMRDMTQQEIADRLGISRPTVCRLLQRSRAEGIVRIDVIAPDGAHHQIERELEERFSLREAIVVTTQQALGRAAAEYLDRILKGGERIGVSWGTTLRAVVDSLRPKPLGPTVVPLVGGVGQITPGIHANDLAHGIAEAFGGEVHLLHAPAVVASARVRRAMASDEGIARSLALARGVDIALVGIGALIPSSTLVHSGYFSADQLAALRRRGGVGDVCTRAFTREGAPVDDTLERRILAVELSDLRRISQVVGVAGGPAKADAIHGALSGRLVDVLVTDHQAARAILRSAKEGAR